MKKKTSFALCVFSLLIGLALIGVSAYMFSKQFDALSAGLMLGIGLLICALFCFTVYITVRYDKIKEQAEAKARKEMDEVYAFVEAKKREAELLRRGQSAEAQNKNACAADTATPDKDVESAESSSADGERRDDK